MVTPAARVLVAPVVDILRKDAAECDRLGQLTPVTEDALRSTGVVKMLQPKEFGGTEDHPTHFMASVIEIASHSPAAGWVAAVAICATAAAAMAAKESIDSDPLRAALEGKSPAEKIEFLSQKIDAGVKQALENELEAVLDAFSDAGQHVTQLESETEPLREELAKQIGEVEERVGPLEGGAEQVKVAAGKLGIDWS